MEKPAIRAVFFDFGKTVIDYHLDFYFNWLERKFGVSRHYFWPVFAGELLQKYECGMSTKEFIAEFRMATAGLLKTIECEEGRRITYPKFTDAEFVAAWNSVFDLQWPYQDRLLFMRKLRGRGVGVYILSNTNEAHVRHYRGIGSGHAYSPFREVFGSVDRFIASCDSDVQARKTMYDGVNQEKCELVFRKALSIAGAKPEESVFVDDVANYVETFKRMGGHGILCTGNWTKVEHELYTLGICWE